MLEALKSRLDAVGSHATVLVMGYPQLVPEKWVKGAAGCGWLESQETPKIRYVLKTLNVAVKNEVDAIGGNFHFVSATASNSPFAGHELCRKRSDTAPNYFNNAVLGQPDVYTFHPNKQGQTYLALHPLS